MSANILLVKLSSMGDVIHSFPALTEAAVHGHRFDWVVEEAFVSLAAMHPTVDRVIPFGLRRWRKNPLKGMRELTGFVTQLRAQKYERVLDAQGLIKSALLARASGAPVRMGLDSDSAREPAGTRFYTQARKVSWNLHAIDRVRQLFADSLGYAVDLSAAAPAPSLVPASSLPDSVASPIVLVHGTTWASKEYPEAAWRLLVARLVEAGHSVMFLSGSAKEYERARRLCRSFCKGGSKDDRPADRSADDAALIERAVAAPPGTLSQASERIMSAPLVIGVDSGLTHLAAVSGRPTLGLYGPTDAARTGVRGPHAVNLASDFACAPCLQRHCTYRGPVQQLNGDSLEPACFSLVSAERIVSAADALLSHLPSEQRDTQ